MLTGTVTDISLTYVRLETGDGLCLLPNSQVLAAVIGPAPAPSPAAPAPLQPAPLQPAPDGRENPASPLS